MLRIPPVTMGSDIFDTLAVSRLTYTSATRRVETIWTLADEQEDGIVVAVEDADGLHVADPVLTVEVEERNDAALTPLFTALQHVCEELEKVLAGNVERWASSADFKVGRKNSKLAVTYIPGSKAYITRKMEA